MRQALRRAIRRKTALLVVALALASLVAADSVTFHPQTGSDLTVGGVISGELTFGTANDAANSITYNSVTGCIEFEGSTADGIETHLCVADPSSADRVFTLPNVASATIAQLGANTFTGAQTFQSTVSSVATNGTQWNFPGPQSNAGIVWYSSTPQTPDASMLLTGTTSNSLSVAEYADRATDMNNGSCGTAACASSQITIHGPGANTTEYQSLAYWGAAGRSVKTLPETTVTSVVQISVAPEAGSSGTYYYTVYATDGSTPQVRSGRVLFAITNDGGTETCVLGTPEELDNTPTGTLTATIACSTSPTNAVDITIDATSSLGQTTLEAYSRVELVGAGQVTPQ